MLNPLLVHIDGLIYDKQPHGGISRNFTNLVNALALTPGASPVLCLPQGCDWPEGMAEVPRRRVPGPVRLRPSRLFGRLAEALGAGRRRRFWRGLGAGVFHSSYYSAPDGLRIPQVLSLQDTIYEDFPRLFAEPRHSRHLEDKRLAVERASGFIFSSRFALERARAHYPLGARPVLVSPYAVDPRLLEIPPAAEIEEFRRRATGGRPFLLHIGSRYLHKNVARLVEAYAGWSSKDDFVLLLAGGGQPDAGERKRFASADVRGRVLVVPQLGDRELLLAYHAAQAFVFPSLVGSPGTELEFAL